MFYSDVIDMLCLYIQQSLFDLLQNSNKRIIIALQADYATFIEIDL